MIDRVQVKQGSTRPFVRVQVSDLAGAAVDVSGCEAVTFSMVGRNGEVVGDARVGKDHHVLEFLFRPGDTDTPGLYFGTFRARFRDGTVTVPSRGGIPVEVVQRATAHGGSRHAVALADSGGSIH